MNYGESKKILNETIGNRTQDPNVHTLLDTTASVATQPYRTKKKILKYVLNVELGRKEAPEERDEIAMALLS